MVARRAFDGAAFAVALGERLHMHADLEIGRTMATLGASLTLELDQLVPALFVASAKEEAHRLPSRPLRAAKVTTGFGFKADKPGATAWARQHSASMVQDITDQTRQGLRDVMARAFEEHIPPRTAARMIKPLIGLDSSRMQAVMNLRDALIDGAGDLVYAGDRPIRVPEDVTDSFIDQQMERYADHLLNDRALSIARTESIAISAAGSRELWYQAVDEGYLDANAEREWVAADDEKTCPECGGLDGKRAALQEDAAYEGSDVTTPPAHPNCRCSEAIVAPEVTIARAAAEQARVPAGSPQGGQFGSGDGGGNSQTADPRSMTSEQRNKFLDKLENGSTGRLLSDADDNETPARAAMVAAHEAYTEWGAEDINGMLRGNVTPNPATQREVAALDAMFKEYGSPLETDTVLLRGVGDRGRKNFEKLGVGDSFHDPAFVSTTFDDAADPSFSKGAVLAITVKAGTKVITGFRVEREVILNRGGKFTVKKIDNSGPKPLLHLEYGS